jgi:hypothetical protein
MSQLEVIKKFIDEHPCYVHQAGSGQTDEDAIEIRGELSGGPITVKVWKANFWVNDRGNTVYPGSHHSERYEFDFERCKASDGWTQYDTDQDAWYFGVWVHEAERLTFTYAEGDITLVECPTEESFRAELADMARCYGPPPPAFRVIGEDFTAEVYAAENAHGREIPADGVEVETLAEATKLVLGGGQ